MPRTRNRVETRARHRKVLARNKGHRGKRRTNYKLAHESMMHALRYAWVDRRKRKRQFRRLWIERINAAARQHGLSYSQLMNGLKRADVEIDRKLLADLAVRDDAAFAQLAEMAKGALAG